jgi:hypothetical protein
MLSQLKSLFTNDIGIDLGKQTLLIMLGIGASFCESFGSGCPQGNVSGVAWLCAKAMLENSEAYGQSVQ